MHLVVVAVIFYSPIGYFCIGNDGACDIGFFGNGGGAGATVLKKLCASAVETDMRR
jgi:hypothetical protein